MASRFKLNILFKDRVGIVADISDRLAEHDLNILSMEVHRKKEQADVYFEVEENTQPISRGELFDILDNIPDLVEIRFARCLPYEVRENRIRVVLDNISDIVIAIDRDGNLTSINKVACRMLGCVGQSVIGLNVKSLNLPDNTILKCLKGHQFNHIKKTLVTAKGRFQYLATGRPIRDDKDQIIGAVEIGKGAQEIKRLARTLSQPSQVTFNDIVGKDQTIKAAIEFAQKIAETDTIISIRGDSGTGKELFARAIHTASNRSGPFIPLNCAALPEQLLESELFGYVGGAFTGACKEGKAGLFEAAAKGTLFLDEIAEMPIGSQARILRVIQDKSVRRIGDTRERRVNTRVITATNQNLEEMLAKGRFRQDLFYRINVLPIQIPPLRLRPNDVALLAEHFVFLLAAKLNQPVMTISARALNKLEGHNWPGNVRELKNVIERGALLSDGNCITADAIWFSHEIGSQMMLGRLPADAPPDDTLSGLLDHYEKQVIAERLKDGTSIRKTAKRLGVSHTTLQNKLKKHRLRPTAK